MTKMLQVQRPTSRAVARPLRVLVPLIQDDLKQADNAGVMYYVAAGEKLIEAKGQLQIHESWMRWLGANFHLNARTAERYMRAAERARELDSTTVVESTVYELTGEKQQAAARRAKKRKTWRPVHAALDDVDTEAVAQSRQSERDEVQLHRDLALEMIEVGFKALATRLHPDRGGSRDAMARLNRVRFIMKQIAETRRFV